MKSIKAIVVVSIAVAAFVTTGFVLHDSLSSRPAIQFLPFQDLPSGYSKPRAREWHARLLGIGNFDASTARVTEENSRESIYEMLLELALEERALLSDPDLAAVSTQLAVEVIDLALQQGEAANAARLCLAFRWTPVRLQSVARNCGKALARSGISTADPPVQHVEEGVVLVTPSKKLRGSIAGYLSNPYDPSTIHAVAVELARARHHGMAEKLCHELLQLDPELAAELQSELAGIRGIEHPSHELAL